MYILSEFVLALHTRHLVARNYIIIFVKIYLLQRVYQERKCFSFLTFLKLKEITGVFLEKIFLMEKKLLKIYDTGCEIKFALSWRSSKHAQNCMTSKLYHCTSTKENTWFDSKWWILWRASIYSSFS